MNGRNGLTYMDPNAKVTPPFEMPAPEAPQPQAPAPKPMGANGLANPFATKQQPEKMPLLRSGLNALQATLDPAGHQAGQQQRKTEGLEKAKRVLALAEQQAAMPVEQRTAFWQQIAPEIGQLTGVDTASQPIDESQFSDEAMKLHIAKMRGDLGISPDKPEFQAANLGNGGFGAFDPRTGNIDVKREPTVDPVKPAPPPPLNNGMEWDGEKWVENPAAIAAYRKMHPQQPDGGSNAPPSGYRWGPDGNLQKIPGGPADKPQQEYTVKQANDYVAQAKTLDALEGALDQYSGLVDQYGSVTGDRNLNPLDFGNFGGKRIDAAELEAAHTNVLIQMKELFNLGVLNGPDLSIIERSIPPPTGLPSLGSTKESMKAKLGVAQDYITRGRNQIPEEFVERARPNGGPGGARPTSAGSPRSATGWPVNPVVANMAQSRTDDSIEAIINQAFGPDDEGDGPQPGEVQDGYRFLGGDPANPQSWEPAQ